MKKDHEAKLKLEEDEKAKKLAEEIEVKNLGVEIINPVVENSTTQKDFIYYETKD